jgi:AraC-like DNA-binding protein
LGVGEAQDMVGGDHLIPAVRFEGAALPTRQRFEAWRSIIAPFLDTVPLVDKRPFDVRYQTYAVDGIVVSESHSGAHTVDRAARHVRRGDTDHIILRMPSQGQMLLGIGDTPVVLAPGAISLSDLRYKMHGHTDESVHINCMIPRQRIDTRAFDRNPVLQWNCGSPEGRLLTNALRTVWSELPRARAVEAKRLAAGLTGLINGLLSTHPDEQARSAINQALVDAMQAFIRRHLDDFGLTSDTLCRTFGCSRARLYRLFQPYGGVERYIRNQRLDRCFLDLSRTPASLVRINRVATMWGFENPSHFHRLFKVRFGIAPSDVPPRRVDTLQIGPARPLASAEIERLHRWFRQL